MDAGEIVPGKKSNTCKTVLQAPMQFHVEHWDAVSSMPDEGCKHGMECPRIVCSTYCWIVG
jgi:hypothetical protein